MTEEAEDQATSLAREILAGARAMRADIRKTRDMVKDLTCHVAADTLILDRIAGVRKNRPSSSSY